MRIALALCLERVFTSVFLILQMNHGSSSQALPMDLAWFPGFCFYTQSYGARGVYTQSLYARAIDGWTHNCQPRSMYIFLYFFFG